MTDAPYYTTERKPNTLGRRVTTARLDLGMSQEEVATKAGVSRAFIALIETNRARPSYEAMLRICKALKMSPNKFCGWRSK